MSAAVRTDQRPTAGGAQKGAVSTSVRTARVGPARNNPARVNPARIDPVPIGAAAPGKTRPSQAPARPRRATPTGRRPMPTLAPWTPFVGLVCGVIAAGLLGLLLLNTVLAQDAFVSSSLQTQAARLAEQEAALRDQLARAAAPMALAKQAKAEGLVPAGDAPAFLAPDGTVRGKPAAAPTPIAKKAPPSAVATRGPTAGPTSGQSRRQRTDSPRARGGEPASTERR